MSDQPHELNSDQQALVEAVGIANAPLSAAELMAATGLPVDVVLAAGDALISAGWLVDDSRGYGPTEQATQLEVSHARRSQISRQIGAAVATDRPELGGRLLVAGGDAAGGFDLLATAALSGESGTTGAHDLAASALSAAAGLDIADDLLGQLHVVVGQHRKAMGNSEGASQSFSTAALLLEGRERIDALRLCAATEDDHQHPQEAERWLVAAQYEAVRQGETNLYGSLLAVHALTLSRIGFPAEADRALEKGRAILADTGSANDQLSATNEAYILLDRGYARQAEAAFASLAFQSERDGNTIGARFFNVYHARALMAAGKAGEAAALLDSIVEPEGALLFLKQLALTEGAVWFEQWQSATDLAKALTGIIAAEVPQWTNIGHFYLAKALLGLGEIAEARTELAAAYATCPAGTDGWRWRLRCRGLDMVLGQAEGEPWDQTAAENLTDELLVARWFDIACDLMIHRAEIEKDQELAKQAAGLASSLGNPTLAIRAAHAGSLWADSQVADIVRDARSIHVALDDDSREQWGLLPHVAAALSAEPPAPDPNDLTLIDELNETLTAIGLAGSDDLLTPAQRHQRGLVRRRPSARKAGRWLGIAAGIAAVIGVSVVTALALQPDTPVAPPVTVIVTASTSTIPLTVEQTELPAPAERLSGASVAAGDFARTGVTDATGVKMPGGYFWKYTAVAAIRSTPVTYGNLVYFGSQDFSVYAIDQTTKDVFWIMQTGGAVLSTPVVGQIANSEGAIGQGGTTLLVVGSDDGLVYARAAGTPGELDPLWTYRIDAPVRTGPVFSDNLVIVTGGDGRVHAIQGADGTPVWTYPAEDQDPVAAFETSPALANGLIYAGDSDGVMHVISSETGEAVCRFDTGATITTSASIVDGTVYFGDSNQGVYQIPEHTCPTDRGNAGRIQVRADFDVMAYEDHLFMPDGVTLYGYDIPSGEPAGLFYTTPSNISTPSIIADGLLYFGDQNGVLHAVDATTLKGVWTFQTESLIRYEPAIGDGVVFVASGSELWAIGPEAP
ncbi:MAG: PQQ-binding-like beta-propeller repeat protein [Acidimicrobiia bacterium]|nr:PQQ-binding-like beta-propeller repeat protein [Acidimicrobiia bacterium]